MITSSSIKHHIAFITSLPVAKSINYSMYYVMLGNIVNRSCYI